MIRWLNERSPWMRALRSDPFTPAVFVMSLVSLVMALIAGNYMAVLAWSVAAASCTSCWLARLEMVYMQDRHIVRLQVARRFGLLGRPPVVARWAPMTAPNSPSGFHAKDGWYFERIDDAGTVRLTAPNSMGAGARQVVDLDEGTWASAVASVSATGETRETWDDARELHHRSGPQPPLPARGWNASVQVYCPRCGELVAGRVEVDDVRWGGASVVVNLSREVLIDHGCAR